MHPANRASPQGSPHKMSAVHVNPNFRPPSSSTSSSSSSVHINPKFNQASTSSSVHVNPNFPSSSPSVHVNPNFAHRPLPPTPNESSSSSSSAAPHINPKFMKKEKSFSIDASKKERYHEAVAKSVAAKVFVNPKFQAPAPPKAVYYDHSSSSKATASPQNNVSPSSEKENVPSKGPAAKKPTFKKIGNKKLVRIRKNSSSSSKKALSSPQKKSSSPAVTITTTPGGNKFKKIGTKKLIRLRSRDSQAKMTQKSPKMVYKVKTKKKIIKVTPTSNRSLIRRLVTPLSLRRVQVKRSVISPRAVKTPKASRSFNSSARNFYKALNPFKVDRRAHKSPLPSAKSPLMSQLVQTAPHTLARSVPPPKPARQSILNQANTPRPGGETLLHIQGVKYKISDHGRKLNRIGESAAVAASSAATPRAANPVRASMTRKKIYLEGEEFVEDEPGVLIRSRNSMTRQSITNARNRSINTILKSQTRSKQYCMFFNKFGKCNKRDKGVCPYIHDQSKVAVCRKFLLGNCHKSLCLLSHTVAPEKMPSCKFFLEGLCTKENCPYRHVNVNPNAEICPEYLKGFCTSGSDCKLRHVSRCPQFEKTGVCARGSKCAYPHKKKEVAKKKTIAARPVPPAKPKRKSLGHTPAAAATEKKKARTRYFEEVQKDKEEEMVQGSDQEKEAFEAKRKRLLYKVELAKRGLPGIEQPQEDEEAKNNDDSYNGDDSGPYEEIPELPSPPPPQAELFPDRAPIGDLPSFIPLGSSDESEQEEEDKKEIDERLI